MLWAAIPLLIITIVYHFCQKGIEQMDREEIKRGKKR